MKTRIGLWLAGLVPRRLAYYVIIRTTANYSIANPTREVPAIRADELSKWLET